MLRTRYRTTDEWIAAYEPKPGEARLPKEEIPPLDPSVIPNYMGINLCSVKAISWMTQDDGQLVSVAIEFDPSDEPPQTDETPQTDTLQRPCTVCGAKAGEPCVDDGSDGGPAGPMVPKCYHAARVFADDLVATVGPEAP